LANQVELSPSTSSSVSGLQNDDLGLCRTSKGGTSLVGPWSSKYSVTLPFGKSQSDSPVNHYCLIAIHGLNFEGDTHEVHQPSWTKSRAIFLPQNSDLPFSTGVADVQFAILIQTYGNRRLFPIPNSAHFAHFYPR